jgi:hypothetical protein
MRSEKEPLYRKVNTVARGVHHNFGGDARHERNTKGAKDSDAKHGTMHGTKRRGLDYTPLFRFLLSKVGCDWAEVHSEAVARLDQPDPIFWLVALHEHQRRDVVGIGESTYYSGLYVDDEGKLQKVDPTFGPEHVTIQCNCCTHTFNGARVTGKWDPDRGWLGDVVV